MLKEYLHTKNYYFHHFFTSSIQIKKLKIKKRNNKRQKLKINKM